MDLTQHVGPLLADLDRVADDVVAAVWERLPGYDPARLDRADLADVVASNLRAVLTALVQDRLPEAAELAPASALGERRAIQGVPAEGVLASWHTAERFLAARLLETRPLLSGGDAARVLRRLSSITDAMVDASTQAFRRTHWESSEHLDSIATDLVSRLAGGEPLDAGYVEERARLVGVRSQAVHRAASIGWRGATDPIALARAQRLIVDLIRPRLSRRVLSGSRGQVMTLLTEDTDDLLPALQRAAARPGVPEGLVIGLGKPRPRLGESQGSCRESVAAVRVGFATGADRTVVEFGSVILEVLLLDNPLDAHDLATAVLGPLRGNDRLVETLDAYLAQGLSVRATAVQLAVHENTVGNRLRRVVDLMGLGSPAELVRADVLLALRAREIEQTVGKD